MNGFVQKIEELAVRNGEFQRVLYTPKHCKLVLTGLKLGRDQSRSRSISSFARRKGPGRQFSTAQDPASRSLSLTERIRIIINAGCLPVKLYTPPNHRDGVVHRTHDEAEADDEHDYVKKAESRVL